MSHSKIRTEKVCLNCGAETTGRFCSVCGQENIEPKQTVWHLITHFFSDITHFDGKFFLTVKDLFAKPGFLSKEYMLGRRVSYLDPIRMYIFTSAFFFLIFFSMFDIKQMHIGGDKLAEIQKDPELQQLISKAKTTGDSLRILRNYNATSTPFVKLSEDSTHKTPGIHFKMGSDEQYASAGAYDSAQKALPPAKRDGWMMRKWNIRKIQIGLNFKNNPGGEIKGWIANFMHNFPKVLFISLPVFAFLLKLIYIRRKDYYYVDHGIFSIHLYIFTFLVLLVLFGINALKSSTGWHFLTYLEILIFLYPFFYYYKAMRKFYGQGRWKTIFKYLLLLLLAFIVQLFIFSGAFLISVVES